MSSEDDDPETGTMDDDSEIRRCGRTN